MREDDVSDLLLILFAPPGQPMTTTLTESKKLELCSKIVKVFDSPGTGGWKKIKEQLGFYPR